MATNKTSENIKNKKLLWLAVSCFFVVLITILSFIIFKYWESFFGGDIIRSVIKTEQVDNNCPDCVRRAIDGIYVEKGKENYFPFAVIIENLFEARPQFGLSRANLVYEAEAEGHITRFLAVFADGENIEKIGPVRSARPYFVDWARELSALFVHVGGSPEALVKIKQENVFDMNEFYQGGYFWRAQDKKAPHNVYTSSDNLNQYAQKNQSTEGVYFGWPFKDDAKQEERGEVLKISINFDLADFKVYWEYSKEDNNYLRYMDGSLHRDAIDGQPIKAKNIIVQYVKATVIDDVLRLKMEHVGNGKAILCQDGFCQEGGWSKQSRTARTRFYKTDGEDFEFNAGPTWIEVVRPEIEVVY